MIRLRSMLQGLGPIGAWLCLVLCGCRPAEEPPAARPPGGTAPGASAIIAQRASGSEEPRAGFDWSPYVGRCVVAQGYRAGAKIGPRLEGGAFAIGVALAEPGGDEAWWALPGGARVRVRGVVSQRSDLPVFIHKEGEPMSAGIPVPEGTDVEKARRRYVIEGASVSLVRAVSEVEADLAGKVGQDVRLEGTVWSLNNHWWFNHDGVELHLEGQKGLPGWSDMHGRAAILSGRLDRRPLPRLDQITLKPNPDLAEAFLLHVREVAEHPGWAIEDCAAE